MLKANAKYWGMKINWVVELQKDQNMKELIFWPLPLRKILIKMIN